MSAEDVCTFPGLPGGLFVAVTAGALVTASVATCRVLYVTLVSELDPSDVGIIASELELMVGLAIPPS